MPRAALVTGASYGIGQACALALAHDGFHVAVSELNPKDLADTVAKIEAEGSRALTVALDLRSLPSIEAAMKEVVAGFGQLDVLVNSAGVTLNRPALEMTGEEWDAVLDVNLKGTFFMLATAEDIVACVKNADPWLDFESMCILPGAQHFRIDSRRLRRNGRRY